MFIIINKDIDLKRLLDLVKVLLTILLRVRRIFEITAIFILGFFHSHFSSLVYYFLSQVLTNFTKINRTTIFINC